MKEIEKIGKRKREIIVENEMKKTKKE